MNKIKQFLKKIEDFLYSLYEFDKHMKKSILFLLIPIFSFGQDLVSSEDGIDIDLDFIGTTAGITNLSKVQVNDTIMVGIDLNNLSAYEITYIHVDIEYNTAAFALVDQEWDVPDGAQESVFSWTNVKWTPDPNHPVNDLWAQWSSGGGNYGQTNGWNVDHWQAVSTTGFEGTYVTMFFKVKDADVENYEQAINITMARAADNTGDQEYVHPAGTVLAYPTQYIEFQPLEDLDSNIYVRVDFNENVDPTKVKLVVKELVGEDETIVGTMVLDQNGDANITEFITKSDVDYAYEFVWNGTEEELQNLKDQIVTISDVVITLEEAGEFEHGGVGEVFGPIQYITADVDGNQEITGQDAFTLLAHVLEESDLYSEYDAFDEFAAVIPAEFYDSVTIETLFDDDFGDELEEPDIDFSQSSVDLIFRSAMFGDANLSHSVEQGDQENPSLTAKGFQYGTATIAESFIDAIYTVGLENGKVVATLEILSSDTSALQIKLDYDNTRLAFEEVVFDTGNTTTNFGSAKNGRVNLGSINSNGEAIPRNSTIKVVFDGNVSSTVGLVNIFNTDAASISGLQQILRLQ